VGCLNNSLAQSAGNYGEGVASTGLTGLKQKTKMLIQGSGRNDQSLILCELSRKGEYFPCGFRYEEQLKISSRSFG